MQHGVNGGSDCTVEDAVQAGATVEEHPGYMECPHSASPPLLTPATAGRLQPHGAVIMRRVQACITIHLDKYSGASPSTPQRADAILRVPLDSHTSSIQPDFSPLGAHVAVALTWLYVYAAVAHPWLHPTMAPLPYRSVVQAHHSTNSGLGIVETGCVLS